MPVPKSRDYIFAVRECESQKMVELEIRPHAPKAQEFLKNVSHKMFQAVKGFHDIEDGGKCPNWAKWKVHEWSEKDVPERVKHAAWTGDVLAGFVWMWHGYPSSVRSGETVTYIEVMAATPTNIQTQIWSRNLAGVGVALLAFTAWQSLLNRNKGNFSLHASDEETAKYYRHLNEKRDNKLFESDVLGVEGVDSRTEHAKTQRYFETKLDGALALLGDYKNG